MVGTDDRDPLLDYRGYSGAGGVVYVEVEVNILSIDRFSKQSKEYAASRPTYPDALFEFLSEQTPAHQLAWDCGTGNGQAAIRLVEYFEKIYATDISAAQLENARPHQNIQYVKLNEGRTALQHNSVDLVTAAQAAHWFDLEKFYREADRVLRPRGIIALWGYGFISASDNEIDRIFQKLGREILKEYWDENVNKIWNGYDSFPFPFEEIDHPEFIMKIEWSLDQFVSYVSSWSAAQKFKEKNGSSPVDSVWDDLVKSWKDPNLKHSFSTPLTIRVGKKT